MQSWVLDLDIKGLFDNIDHQPDDAGGSATCGMQRDAPVHRTRSRVHFLSLFYVGFLMPVFLGMTNPMGGLGGVGGEARSSGH
jgi:hypothetical protein